MANKALVNQIEIDIYDTLREFQTQVFTAELIRKGSVRSTDLVICDEADYLMVQHLLCFPGDHSLDSPINGLIHLPDAPFVLFLSATHCKKSKNLINFLYGKGNSEAEIDIWPGYYYLQKHGKKQVDDSHTKLYYNFQNSD